MKTTAKFMWQPALKRLALTIAVYSSFMAHGQNRALKLNGSTDWVVIPSSSSLNLGNRFTIEAWVNYQPSSYHSPRIVSKGWSDSSGYEFLCNGWGSPLHVDFTATGFGTRSGGNPPGDGSDTYRGYWFSDQTHPPNTWTHLAVTYDGSTLRLLINGQIDRSFAVTESLPVTPTWRIGGCLSGPVVGTQLWQFPSLHYPAALAWGAPPRICGGGCGGRSSFRCPNHRFSSAAGCG